MTARLKDDLSLSRLAAHDGKAPDGISFPPLKIDVAPTKSAELLSNSQPGIGEN